MDKRWKSLPICTDLDIWNTVPNCHPEWVTEHLYVCFLMCKIVLFHPSNHEVVEVVKWAHDHEDVFKNMKNCNKFKERHNYEMMMTAAREDAGGNCVSKKLWLSICHLGTFIIFAIQDWVTNKSYEHNGDPWMKHVLNMQCLLFKRKSIICIRLHLLELQKVAKDINTKCSTFCRLWKVSFSVVPTGIPPLEWCFGRPADGHL